MATRQPDRPSSGGDSRRGMMAVVALSVGVLFAYTRAEREGMYMIPGFSFGLAPFAIAPDGTPATDAGAAVMTTFETMQSRIVSTRFRHEIEVNEDLGLYDFDSSGLVAWVLQRAAPDAFAALGRDRPVAEDFARVIHEASESDDTNGWRRITRVSALAPGDVLAWETPHDHREGGLTGHVAIVVGMPVRVLGLDECWSVRIADSTNEFHQWDSRFLGLDMDGGVGTGIITLAVAEDGHAFAYGWQGPWSPVFRRNEIELGRVTR